MDGRYFVGATRRGMKTIFQFSRLTVTAREKLALLEGERIRVTALIERHANGIASTYLIRNVRDVASGSLLTGHLWLQYGAWASGFRPLDEIEFTARVIPYAKGWLGDCDRMPETASSPRKLDEVSDAKIVVFGPQPRLMPDGSVRPDSTDAVAMASTFKASHSA